MFLEIIFSNSDLTSLFEEVISSYEMAMLEVEPNAESSNANGVDNSEMIKLYELEGQYMTLVSLSLFKCIDKIKDQLNKKSVIETTSRNELQKEKFINFELQKKVDKIRNSAKKEKKKELQ